MPGGNSEALKRKLGILLAVLVGIIILSAGIFVYLRKQQSVTHPHPRAVSCVRNLKQINTAARMYAAYHDSMFPPDLRILTKEELPGDKLDEEFLQCPEVSERKNDSVDYEYVAAGEGLDEVDGNTILAYHEHDQQDLINILFGDGHVSDYKAASIDEVLEEHEGLHKPDAAQWVLSVFKSVERSRIFTKT